MTLGTNWSAVRTFALVALATWLVAAAPAPAPAQSAKAAPQRCVTTASSAWAIAAGLRLRIEAATDGPSCRQAVATLVVRDPRGNVIWHDSFRTEHVMVLSDATTRAAMQSALTRWSADRDGPATTAQLPVWPAGAEGPQGEFPFMPAEGMTRADYMALRTQRRPLWCFVAGMESMRCLYWDGNGLETAGLQLFPG